jgi:orotate phosphoribosyltransferase
MDVRKSRLIELLLLHSFQVRENPPFVLSSGRTSPYYVDCKPVTLHHEGLHLIGALGYEIAKHLGVTAVGGLTLGADPIANAIAMHSHLRSRPLRAFVVRKEAKGHGTERWIEGSIEPGTHVAVLDDVITTGASTIQAIDRAREAGLIVEHVVALVDREEGGAEAIEGHGVQVHAVVTRTELLARIQAVKAHAAELV